MNISCHVLQHESSAQDSWQNVLPHLSCGEEVARLPSRFRRLISLPAWDRCNFIVIETSTQSNLLELKGLLQIHKSRKLRTWMFLKALH